MESYSQTMYIYTTIGGRTLAPENVVVIRHTCAQMPTTAALVIFWSVIDMFLSHVFFFIPKLKYYIAPM